MNRPELTEMEEKIVDLISEGYARWKIAEILHVGETTVRTVIRGLCERYDCPSLELPDVIRRKENNDNSSLSSMPEQ